MNHFNALLILSCFYLTMTGCTSQQIYDGIQKNRYYDCENRNESQREECQQQYEKSYEDYSSERADNL